MPEAHENNVMSHYSVKNNCVDNLDLFLNTDDFMCLTELANTADTNSLPVMEQSIFMEPPRLRILVQPADKFRFRYRSEMMAHGSLGGDVSKRSLPKVKLENYNGKAIIRCTLVTTNEEDRMPHAHRLIVKKGDVDIDDPHDIEVSHENDYTAVFQGMGIIHTARKNLKDELMRRRKLMLAQKAGHTDISRVTLSDRDILEIGESAEKAQKTMNLNSVALCFQAFYIDNGELVKPLTEPVYSNPINNLKSAMTGELKICRMDKQTGSCEGNEEVFMFVEKVGKKNIKIKFFELDERDLEVWYAYGKFSEIDVHHQYAIAFRTPAYRDINITQPKTVFIKLERPTDGESSNPLQFTYKPNRKNVLLSRKRPRMSSCNNYIQNLPINNHYAVNNNSPNDYDNLFSDLTEESLYCQYINDSDFMELLGEVKQSEQMEEYQQMLQTDGVKDSNDEAFSTIQITKIMKIIEEKGKDVNKKLRNVFTEKTTHGNTLLHLLIRNESYAEVNTVLQILGKMNEYTCEIVNVQNMLELTPLHMAVIKVQPKIVETLLLLGADITKKDMKGLTALDCAIEQNETYAINVCIDHLLSKCRNNVDLSPLLITTVKRGAHHAFVSLIKSGADVNSVEMTSGRNALHLAIDGGYKNIVMYLLKRTQIDVNAKTYSGYTALDYAEVIDWPWKEEICQLLKQLGASSNVSSKNSDFKNEKECTIKNEIESPENSEDEEDDNDDNDNEDNDNDDQEDLTENKQEVKNMQPDGESMNVCPVKSEIHEMNEKAITQLSEILDSTKGWIKLAEKTGLHYLIKLLNDSKESSPTSRVINYALENNFTPDKLLVILREIDETKAAEKLSEILSNK